MSVGAENWCLLRDHHVEMYPTLLLVQLLEAEDVPASCSMVITACGRWMSAQCDADGDRCLSLSCRQDSE